jgi:hypothetical protein
LPTAIPVRVGSFRPTKELRQDTPARFPNAAKANGNGNGYGAFSDDGSDDGAEPDASFSLGICRSTGGVGV